jgi:hypothetical protein
MGSGWHSSAPSSNVSKRAALSTTSAREIVVSRDAKNASELVLDTNAKTRLQVNVETAAEAQRKIRPTDRWRKFCAHQEQNQVTKQRGKLFVLQRDHGIDAQRAARGRVASADGNTKQEQRTD